MKPNSEGEGSLPGAAVARTITRAQERFGIAKWSAHDLRRTALTGMAKLGVAPIVLGHIANHRTTTKAGMTLSVYVQHAYEKEKREALELWADRLQGIIAGKRQSAEDALMPTMEEAATLFDDPWIRHRPFYSI
jgi:hypothetical protein